MNENAVSYFAFVMTIAHKVVGAKDRVGAIKVELKKHQLHKRWVKQILEMSLHKPSEKYSPTSAAIICIINDIRFFSYVLERASINLT